MGDTEFLKVEIFEEEFDQRENCKQSKVISFLFCLFASKNGETGLVDNFFCET